MALTATMNAAQDEITTVCDSRVHPAQPEVTEEFTIIVRTKRSDSTTVEEVTRTGTRVVKPAIPETVDDISVTDSSGRVWTKVSDDKVTAIFRA